MPSINIPDRFQVGPMSLMEVDPPYGQVQYSSDHNYSISHNLNPAIVKLSQEIDRLKAEKGLFLSEIRDLKHENSVLRRQVGYFTAKYHSFLNGDKIPKKTQHSIGKGNRNVFFNQQMALRSIFSKSRQMAARFFKISSK